MAGQQQGKGRSSSRQPPPANVWWCDHGGCRCSKNLLHWTWCEHCGRAQRGCQFQSAPWYLQSTDGDGVAPVA
eukprot:4617341-Pyramimonas_sp.AAC.1